MKVRKKEKKQRLDAADRLVAAAILQRQILAARALGDDDLEFDLEMELDEVLDE